jgi:hypothetical protein
VQCIIATLLKTTHMQASVRAYICAHVTQVGGLLLIDRTKKKIFKQYKALGPNPLI